MCILTNLHPILQETGESPQDRSRKDGSSLRTSVSISHRGHANSSALRPSSAPHASRISLSTGGLRGPTPPGSASHPAAGPASAPGIQEASRRQSDAAALVMSNPGMPGGAAGGDGIMQRQASQHEGSACVQSQGFRGSKRRPHSAQASARRPLPGSSKASRRPQSANPTALNPPTATPTAQPPFWTGRMQQNESSHHPEEDCIFDAQSPNICQQPSTCEDGVQQPAGHQGYRQRPQSASPGRAPPAAGASSSGTALASGPCTALRTVPEDAAAALQPSKPLLQPSGLPEGRAGSLRAWRTMYTQPSVSQAASHEETGQSHGRRPRNASLQQKASCPSSATQSHSASTPPGASHPNSAQYQVVQQEAEVRRGSHSSASSRPGSHSSEKQAGSAGEGRGGGEDCSATGNRQAYMLPRPGGRSPVAEEGMREPAAALNLTELER